MRAQDKLTFLLSFVPYLIDRDRVSVAEAAEHFGVSPEYIRQAVELIAVSGVPGSTSSYQHEDLFDISWDAFENDEIVLTHLVAIDDSPRFSAREAAALIAGLQHLSSLPENADREALTTLMGKLSRGAAGDPGRLAVEPGRSDATLAVLHDSVEQGMQVEFDYLNARGERERRRVEVLRVESENADWYVRAWCHTRQAVRTFRLDRISDPALTTEALTHRAGEVTVPERLFEGSPDDLTVTIDVTPSAYGLLTGYLTEGAKPQQVDGMLRTTIRVAHFHSLKRLVAGLSGSAVVVEPEDARRAVADWANAGLAQYDAG